MRIIVSPLLVNGFVMQLTETWCLCFPCLSSSPCNALNATEHEMREGNMFWLDLQRLQSKTTFYR